MLDPIPREDVYLFTSEGPYARAEFYAFNTKVGFQALLASAEGVSFASSKDALPTSAEGTSCTDGNASTREAISRVFAEARALCRRYERLFSRTLPHSDIARINAAQGAPVEVSSETYRLLQSAQYYCDMSKGTFDITIGPAIALWDFACKACPQKEALAASVTHVNWRGISMHAEEGRAPIVQLEDPQAAIDVGGIAKGFIADRIAELFRMRGLADFSINLGGNVVVGGMNAQGTSWVVGIRDPQHPGDETALLGAVELSDASVVTSGTAERSFVRDGVLYHHILNPRTGMPVQTDVASATVVAKRSIDAEGFSTTLVALGLERGMDFARANPAIAAAFVVDNDNNLYQA